MPATPTVNPTKAALEAAVLELTDAQIADALRKADSEVRRTYKEREAYAWPREAQRTLLEALARRLERGRVAAGG
jgi:methylphosphotriester-DNA--protein-cysteine methyltransferase